MKKHLREKVTNLKRLCRPRMLMSFGLINLQNLVELILKGDLENFLRWDVISETMLFCDKKKPISKNEKSQNHHFSRVDIKI